MRNSVKMRERVDTKNMTRIHLKSRIKVIENIACNFVQICDRHKGYYDHIINDMERLIEGKIVKSMMMVGWIGHKPMMVINLDIDQNKHVLNCNIKSDIDVKNSPSGIPKSSKEILETVDKYVKNIKKIEPKIHISLWFRTPAKNIISELFYIWKYVQFKESSKIMRALSFTFICISSVTYGLILDHVIKTSVKRRLTNIPEIGEMSVEIIH